MNGLATSLATLDRSELTALFEARPDLVDPPPRDHADLAARAARQQSLIPALRGLDRFTTVVLEALVLSEGPLRPSMLAPMLGAGEGDVAQACRRLVGLGLAIGHPDGTTAPLTNMYSAMEAPPLGLGPEIDHGLHRLPVDALRAIASQLGVRAKGKADLMAAIAAAVGRPETLRPILASLPSSAASLLDRLDHQLAPILRLPWGWEGGAPRSATDHLASRALLVPLEWDVWTVPLEVSIALRGGRLVYPVPAAEPQVGAAALSPADASGPAAEAATCALRQLVELLDELDARPASVLKQGGVGVQQVRRLAKRLEVDEERAALLLELAFAAGLIGVHGDVVLPTEGADRWRAEGTAERWVTLAQAWWATPRHPSLAGVPSAKDDKPIPALVGHDLGGERPRAAVLGRILEETHCSVRSAELIEAVRWRHPRRFEPAPAPVEELVGWVLAEARLLGVLVEPPGRPGSVAPGPMTAALVADAQDEAVAAARRALPPAVDRFTVQADLTVIVAGELIGPAAAVLADLADRESAGSASVWRLSQASVARALDLGHDAAALVAFLEEHATHGVPQAVRYLLTDLGRRHGQVRVVAAMTVVHGEDTALLAEVQAHRRCAALRLRAVAPTVLISATSPPEVADALRAAGFLPGVEGSDGSLVVDRPTRPRAKPWRQAVVGGGPVSPRAPTTAKAAAVADRLCAAPPARLAGMDAPAGRPPASAAPSPPLPPPALSTVPPGVDIADLVDRQLEDPDEIREALVLAVDVGAMVELGYVNGKGQFSAAPAVPLDVGEHDLLALGSHGQQTYLLDRLRYVVVLDEGSDLLLAEAEGW